MSRMNSIEFVDVEKSKVIHVGDNVSIRFFSKHLRNKILLINPHLDFKQSPNLWELVEEELLSIATDENHYKLHIIISSHLYTLFNSDDDKLGEDYMKSFIKKLTSRNKGSKAFISHGSSIDNFR